MQGLIYKYEPFFHSFYYCYLFNASATLLMCVCACVYLLHGIDL